MAGVMKDWTTRVSKSSPSMMVEPIWPAMRRSLASMEPMVKANTRPAVVTTAPVLPMERMMPVFSPAWISFLEPGDQQQVVVRSHGQHDHDGHREHQPVQRHVQQVLPNQYRDAKGGAQRYGDRADDDHGGDQASGDAEHDHEDQGDRCRDRDHQVIHSAVVHVLVGGCGAAEVEVGGAKLRCHR